MLEELEWLLEEMELRVVTGEDDAVELDELLIHIYSEEESLEEAEDEEVEYLLVVGETNLVRYGLWLPPGPGVTTRVGTRSKPLSSTLLCRRGVRHTRGGRDRP